MASFFFDIMEGTALPPLQVGVWIPKAKMGPEADCFRPLGMPDTLARLVDGTVAAKVMHATAQNMHPSQTVMSMFKEPQRAVSGIQNILDSTQAACTLLADLSKAFEPFQKMDLAENVSTIGSTVSLVTPELVILALTPLPTRPVIKRVGQSGSCSLDSSWQRVAT